MDPTGSTNVVTNNAITVADGVAYIASEICDTSYGVGSERCALAWQTYDGTTGFSTTTPLILSSELDNAGFGGSHYLQSIAAVDGGSLAYLSANGTASTGGPATRELDVDLTDGSVDGLSTVDDGSPVHKHNAVAYDSVNDKVDVCWTEVGSGDDDSYCDADSPGGWPGSPFQLGTNNNLGDEDEDHSQPLEVGGERAIIFHEIRHSDSASMIRVRLHESGGWVSFGLSTDGDWPHLVEQGGTLHAVWYDTSASELYYAKCSGAFTDCDTNGDWTITPVGIDDGSAQHPYVAVDSLHNVFVAYEYDVAGTSNDRVRVAFMCDGDGSFSAAPTLDGSHGREELGYLTVQAWSPIAVDTSASPDQLIVTYVANGSGSDYTGRLVTAETTASQLCP